MEECWESLIVEAKAMLFGIKVVVEFGFRNVLVESECIHLVNAISSRERGASSFHRILYDIIHATSKLDFVSWSFVRKDDK